MNNLKKNKMNKTRPNLLKRSKKRTTTNSCKTIDSSKTNEVKTDKTNDNIREKQKLVVSADEFSNFENLKLHKLQRKSSFTSESSTKELNSRKNSFSSETSSKTTDNRSRKNSCSSDTTTKDDRTENVVKNRESFPENINFEEVIIKKEIHENDNKIKIPDKSDKVLKEGELQKSVKASHETTQSFVSNKLTSPTATAKNRVFIIKNQSGKSVTLVPKSAPVVLNKEANTENKPENSVNKITVPEKTVVLNKNGLNVQKTVVITKNCFNKTSGVKLNPLVFNRTLKTLKTLKPLVPQSQCKNLIQRIPNTQVMKISDFNKSQKYFHSGIKLAKTENLLHKPEVPKIIDLTDDSKNMKNTDLNSMPHFSKIIHVLTESSSKKDTSASKNVLTDSIKIPIYVDSSTQTENTNSLRDTGVQTEVYIPSPSPSSEELPNITNLLEYVFNTPKYSSGLDDMKKSDLIDMSKNIVNKGKNMSKVPKGEDELKKQLFLDLKDCATFDFLGNKPIHNAVIENNINFLRRQIFALRLRKISIDIANNQGQTALQLAVYHNCNLEIISILLGNGASANILDNEGNNLIHLAVINSTHYVLEVLIKYLINPIKEINRKNDEGLTPLMIASIDSKPEMVDMLLRNKADPNLRDEKSGRTALFHAVELNCNFVINLLLKYKADPKVRNFFGLTALDAAKDLDISDSTILESDTVVPNNQTSVIVNNINNGPDSPNITYSAPGSRKRPQNVDKNAKKSKLSFVPSLMKVQISEVKNSSVTKKRKK